MPRKAAATKKPAARRATPKVEDLNEVVTMRHPHITGTATATRRALKEVWSAKGWKEADTADVEADPSLEPDDTGDSDPISE